MRCWKPRTSSGQGRNGGGRKSAAAGVEIVGHGVPRRIGDEHHRGQRRHGLRNGEGERNPDRRDRKAQIVIRL